MNKVTKARAYNSAKLQELLDEVAPLEMEQTKVKMQLAARIEDIMKAKGWNKSQFAEKIGKNPSEITKWLSGTQNLTIDVLTEIAFTLGVELAELFEKAIVQDIHQIKAVIVSNASYNEMRHIKDGLPHVSTHAIAEALNISEETVRNYFGGTHYDTGETVGVYFEQGYNGGVVYLEDTAILEKAREILAKMETEHHQE